MESQKKHIKFMAQKYLDSSQRETPQTSVFCKRQGSSWQRSEGDPLIPGHLWRKEKQLSAILQDNGSELFFIVTSLVKKLHLGVGTSEEKAQGRLQFVLNTDSPGPAAYSPPTMACRETIAPSYTFGWKTPPREGGGRRAWQKSWFMSKNPFWRKVDFSTETNWPSPSQYGQLLGTKLGNLSNTPNFTFGQRGEYCLTKKGIIDEPGPNRYNIDRARTLVLHRSPSIIINPAPLTLFKWIEKVETPGPGAYNVDKGYNARLPKCPSFYIQGVRRPKKHETGPFCTL